jgi:Fic family protein
MYVRKEAVLSSQIEGTQASLQDLLEFEVEGARRGTPADVQEVVNYVAAMNFGLERLAELPLSLRLMREIHSRLLEGVRGGGREPGEFRSSQNWIGPAGCTLRDAIFVPPPPGEVLRAMGQLESFIHSEEPMPVLLKCGLAHAQFETIHPFLDGNGRVGRLLITFMLCWRGVLKRPLLYLSDYLKRNRQEYYDRLQSVRDDGDWEGWIRFFLEGIRLVAREASGTARQIQALRESHRELVSREISGTPTGQLLLDHLFRQPMVSVNYAAKVIGRSYPVTNDLIAKLEALGLLREVTGGRRNRVYSYAPYLDLLA